MATSSRKKMEIPDKAWLETLKFLMGPQWLKMRFVSRQIAEVVQGNIAELPRIIIDNVKFSKTNMAFKPTDMVAADVFIPVDKKRYWFMKRGINLDAPTGLQHQSAIIGMGAKYGAQQNTSISYHADVSELGKTSMTTRRKQKMIRRKLEENSKPNPVIFSAEFNPNRNEYSWASMEYFLGLLYNPLTYIQKIEMDLLEIDQTLTDAFFLGEDYGSYIRCGTFTVKGDLSKSLLWIQRNVSADTIYVPGDFTDVANSFQETSHFLLNKPWICANQSQNKKTVKIKVETIRNLECFIATLIKEFRTLTAIEHATPSIEFSFMNFDEINLFNLNYLAWNPEVVKLESEDLQSAEAVYVISKGRNRMEIAIFKRREVESSFMKMDDFSRIFSRKRMDPTCDVSLKTYTIESAAQSWEKVHILNDTWLEALKFLSFRQWSKALFVSRQLAGVVQRNISRLPCIVIDSATMLEVCTEIYDKI